MSTIAEKPTSIRIRHRYKHGGMALIPINHKRLYKDSARKCPNCQVIHTDSFGHPVKTVHLWLDDTGACLISPGVLADLQHPKVGMPNLDIVADIVDPPAITLEGNRFEVDQDNARIHYWKEPTIV